LPANLAGGYFVAAPVINGIRKVQCLFNGLAESALVAGAQVTPTAQLCPGFELSLKFDIINGESNDIEANFEALIPKCLDDGPGIPLTGFLPIGDEYEDASLCTLKIALDRRQ
jgi:hypothetical protein